MRKLSCFAATIILAFAGAAKADLVNPSFEYGQANGSFSDHNDASIDPAGGWFTTEADHQIEVWGSGFNGVPSYDGNNFVELNANAVSTLYQDVSGIAAGSVMGFEFAHRGRLGDDTMQVTITDAGADGIFGTADDTVLFQQDFTDGNTAWGFYSDSGIVALGNEVRFAYDSISAAGGNPTVGNFLDDAHFGVGVGSTVPEPFSMILLGTVVAGLGIRVRFRRPA
jgi:hypothetical protein